MVACEELKKIAKRVYPSSVHPGWFDLSPPVRLVNINYGREEAAWAFNPTEQKVMLLRKGGDFPLSWFRLHSVQGRRFSPIEDELWRELEELLNRVSDEREEYDDGPGSAPTANARLARDMLDKLWMERRKHPSIQ